MAANPFAKPEVNTTAPGIIAPSFGSPWLLYANPHMPYSRRVIIYLREKGIPESQVQVVLCDSSNKDNEVTDNSSQQPIGSLPILAIPSNAEDADNHGRIYIRQSLAIMYFLEELCNDFQYGFTKGRCGSLLGKPGIGPLERARIAEVIGFADQLMATWSLASTIGTDASTTLFSTGADEILRWGATVLMDLERCLQDRDMSLLRGEVVGHVRMADIVLFELLEFVEVCYGVDVTLGSGAVINDVDAENSKEEFPKLYEFYHSFKTRDSARCNADGTDLWTRARERVCRLRSRPLLDVPKHRNHASDAYRISFA